MKISLNALPAGLLCLYVSKLAILGASYQDAPALLTLLGLCTLLTYLPSQRRLALMEADMEALKKEHSDLKSYIAGQKLSNSLRTNVR